jgi:hypothetical protein
MKYNRLQTIEHDVNSLNILVQKQLVIPDENTPADDTGTENGDPAT